MFNLEICKRLLLLFSYKLEKTDIYQWKDIDGAWTSVPQHT